MVCWGDTSHLSLCFVLLMLTSRQASKVYIVAFVAFIVGMVAEALGVNTV